MTLIDDINAAADPSGQYDRMPPHSTEAEQCLLGSVILDRRAWDECRRIVNRDCFFNADNQTIWDCLSDLYARGVAVDVITLREELIRRDVWDEIGGRAYIAQVIGTVPSAAHGPHYAADVAELARRRQLIAVSNDILRRCWAPTRSADPSAEILERSMAALAKVAQVGAKPRAQVLGVLVREVRAQMDVGGVPLVPTGFRDLDALTGGVGLGEMVLIGGRPSMGKSTWAKQVGLRAARAGVVTAFVSLEEGRFKIARNILSSEARVDNHKIRRVRELTQQDWQEVDAAVDRLAGVEMHVIDGVRRLDDIAAELSLLVARHGVQLVIIDYLQRVQAGGRDPYEKAGNAATGVSDLLKDLNVAGVVPVQLNRGVEQRAEKRPTMADLRDSGQLEQDADGVVFLHREDYYHTDEGDYQPTGVAELIVAKWRDGVRGKTVKLKSNLRFQTFDDLDAGDYGDNGTPIDGAF